MVKFDSDWMLIDGQLVNSDRDFPAFNPATKQEIARVPEATEEQLALTVAAVRRSFEQWKQSFPTQCDLELHRSGARGTR